MKQATRVGVTLFLTALLLNGAAAAHIVGRTTVKGKCNLDGQTRRFKYDNHDRTLYAYKTTWQESVLGAQIETIKLDDVAPNGLKKLGRKTFSLTMNSGARPYDFAAGGTCKTYILGNCLPTGDPTDIAKFLRGKFLGDKELSSGGQVHESFQIKPDSSTRGRKGSKEKSGAKSVSIDGAKPSGEAVSPATEVHPTTSHTGDLPVEGAAPSGGVRGKFTTLVVDRRRRLLARLQGSRARRRRLLERVHGSRASKRRLLERLQGF